MKPAKRTAMVAKAAKAKRERNPLGEYRAKRDFTLTSEPAGGAEAGKASTGKRLSYVIQKHAASHLHYDFRLELDGVLLSWAVPKGPSLDPAVKRLAMQTEDHPLAYGSFEGTIPAGEYGGGTVMVWDHGSWSPEGDAHAGIAKGHLSFRLFGEKLRGSWHLVRSRRDEKKPAWLLFKSGDDEASATRDITKDAPDSAKSGRTLDEIAAAARGSVWHSNRAAATKKPRATTKKREEEEQKQHPAPKGIEPEEAKEAARTPSGEGWAHEPRFDGLRALVTRTGKDVAIDLGRARAGGPSKAIDHLAGEIASLDWPDAVLDGEIVALHDDGTPDAEGLARALDGKENARLVYYAFDLLFAAGTDFRARPFLERKERLEAILGPGGGRVRFVPCTVGRGAEVFAQACELGLPGIVSKKVASKYRSGTSGDWVAVSCKKASPRTRATKTATAKPTAPKKAAIKTPTAKHAPRPRVQLTHPDRVLWSEPKTTKEDLARYYEIVASRLLPHVAARPLTLVRCPNGFGKACFFQKHATDDRPKAIAAIDVQAREKKPYMAIHDAEGLASLAQMSVLEIHTWGCHADEVDRPDWWVFDLDPDPAVAWSEVVRAAVEIRERLREVELESWVKTTGGKGLHVCVPVARKLDWEETKVLCASFANAMVRRSPAKYVATITKSKREGKILIDHFRNGRGATAVAPYSTRARAGAPIAMPLTWRELEKTGDGERPVFDVAGVLTAGLPKVDAWKGAAEEKQSVVAAVRVYLAAKKRPA